MNFMSFLIESADDIESAKAHVKRCRQGLRDAQRTGDKDETIEWESALDDALEQLAMLKSAAKKKMVGESADIDDQIKAAEAKLKRAKFDLSELEPGTTATDFARLEDAVEQHEKQVKLLKARRAELAKPVAK